jgi:predicted ferric reductase
LSKPVKSHGRRGFEFYLDALLFLVFLVLLSPKMTGLPIHEWLGIAFTVPLLVHLLLSWSWIATATRRVLAPRRPRDTVNAVLNALLFTSGAVVVVSGLVISQVGLPWLGVSTIDDRTWRATHNQATTWMLIAVGAHIAMNWRWITTAAKNYLLRRRSAP